MDDSTDVHSSSSQPRSTRVRGPTMMAQITKVRQTGVKIAVEFHPRTHACIGDRKNAATFRSYVAFLARTKCSILKDEWKDINSKIKDAIWIDVKGYFTIPQCEDPKKDRLKDEWIRYAGDRWREAIWKEFVKSRDTPEFKEKSQKGRENVARNVYKHVLSRGGYNLLEEKMKIERKLSRDDSTLTDDDRSPSPPPREEKWKRARQKKGGEYTTKEVEVVAEKIDSLVEETKKGTFVSDGRNDILTAAIGTSEHGGRVRGVGKHHKLSTFFGRSSSRQRHDHIDVQEELAQIRSDFDHKLAEERKAMQQTFMETLKSMGFSQPLETNKEVVQSCQKVVVDGSAKASCSAAKGSAKEVELDAVQKLCVMLLQSGDDHLELALSHCKIAINFHVSAKCIRELLMGFNWLDLSILQVWCTYIHRICVEKKISEMYGFMDPGALCFRDNVAKTQSAVKKYIKEKLRDENRVCHLLPFNHGGHWQLIILIPKNNIVVVLCSLHWDLNETMKKIVTDAFGVYQMANGNRKKANWLYPKTRRQPNSNDCGYYVMKNMLDIVSANITDSWVEIFNDPQMLTNNELYDLRLRWATCFLELYGD
ncbi:hypothetical protein QL285_058735 [Trifolium repens]|nr:hypothetical protein QL285_058735 [Trifolium repens]